MESTLLVRHASINIVFDEPTMDASILQYLSGNGRLRLSDSSMADYVDYSRLYRQLNDAECAKMPIVDRLSFANPVFGVYVFWSVALLLKMLATRAAIMWLTNKAHRQHDAPSTETVCDLC